MHGSSMASRFELGCDPDILRSGLERGLDGAWGRTVELVDLEVPRAFPRRGGGLTLELRARVRSRRSGRSDPVLLGGHLLGESEDWPGYAAALPERVLRFEALRLLVPVFPFDPELPLLPEILRAERALSLLRAAGVTGLEQASAVEPRLLGYRLERRSVVRHRLVTGQRRARAPGLVTKLLRPGRLARIEPALRALAAGDATDLAPPTRLVDVGRGLHVMVEASGRLLRELVGALEFEPGCRAAGAALARLHALPHDALPRQEPEVALRALAELVLLASRCRPQLSSGLRALHDEIVARRPAPQPGALAAMHGDFYDKQVLYDRGRATILDWDGLACGDPARDHGNFTAHVALRAAQAPGRAARIESGAAAFARGYGACRAEFLDRARWWEAATLLRLGALYGLRPNSRQLVPGLLQRAARGLDSRARVAVLAALLAASSRSAAAQPPEYMRIAPRPGQTFEISGAMNDDAIFVASDLEALPEPRRLQLRGPLEAVDPPSRALLMYGLRLQLVDDAAPDSDLVALRPGQRIEARCRVDGSGTWFVERLHIRDVKPSDKIKGTITRAAVDGVPPDTLEISGLRILLVSSTDVNRPGESEPRHERQLFPNLARRDRQRPMTTLAGDRLRLLGEYRGHAMHRTDFDLTRRFDSDASEGMSELRLCLAAYASPAAWSFAQLRLRGVAMAEEVGVRHGRVEAHVTQLYVVFRSPGSRRVALQVGRQDFDEPREWIFDEYLDAARLVLYGSGPLVFEAALIRPFHPIDRAFATWTDGFATARWHLDSRSHVAAWVLARSDRDAARHRQPVWIGARYWGPVGREIRPWVDAAVMRGEDKHRALRAWGLDVGATWMAVALPSTPWVTAGYAVGSGDASMADGVDGNFRQTGYEDNWASFGGVARKIYGSLLDPELSNLEVASLGVGARPARASLEVVWHRYRQRVARDELQGSDLVDPPARPNGASRELGWSVELVAASPPLWGRLGASWTFAFFRPGRAFAPRHEDATCHRLDLTTRF